MTLARGDFEPADPARFNNRSLLSQAQAERFATVLVGAFGCEVSEARAVLQSFGFDLQPVLKVVR